MTTEQAEIQERMRNRALGRVTNALNTLKSELAAQGHDTTALTLDAVMAIIEPKPEPLITFDQAMAIGDKVTTGFNVLINDMVAAAEQSPDFLRKRTRTRKAK